jgi:hypothetical protein
MTAALTCVESMVVMFGLDSCDVVGHEAKLGRLSIAKT